MLAHGTQTSRVDTAGLSVMEKVSQKPKEADLGDDRQEHCCDQGQPGSRRPTWQEKVRCIVLVTKSPVFGVA